MFLTRTRLYLLPMQPPTRLEHIFWEDLGDVSVKRLQQYIRTYTVILSLYPEFAKYVSEFLKGTASIIYLIPNILRAIFKNTEIIAPMNTTVWSIWQKGDPRISNVFFADYNTYGPGLRVASRPHFSTELTRRKAAEFSIASAVGHDYKKWVDASYIV